MTNIDRIITYDTTKIASIVSDLVGNGFCDYYCPKYDSYGCGKNKATCAEGVRQWLTQEEAESLKPCPFCGGEAKLNITQDKHVEVYCELCNTTTKTFNTVDDAIKFWNKRSHEEY